MILFTSFLHTYIIPKMAFIYHHTELETTNYYPEVNIMFKKILVASLVVMALVIPIAGFALAQQGGQGEDGGRRGRPGKGRVGIVTAVDAAANEFSIENRDGESITFMVNADTKYLSREGELESFDDLVVDMVVGVKAVGNEEGTLVAKAVAYIDPAMVNAERAGGEVIAVGSDSFTIMTRNDEELTLQVDEDTRFKSRDGSLEGLDDLEVGMKVGTIYIENEDGSLLAKAVLSGKQGACGPGKGDGEGRPERDGESDSEGAPAIAGAAEGKGHRCRPGRPGGEGGPDGEGRPNRDGNDQS